MTFNPVIPAGGFVGWSFLNRTLAKQQAQFNAQPRLTRDEDYFRAKIGGINTAEQLVNDPRLMRVALGAFGLDGDVQNKAFIQKILEGGTLTTDALANRLANKQYRKLSAAFGFGDFSTPRNKISDFPEKILSAYRERQFEVAVGEQDSGMRLALNLRRELPLLATESGSDTSKWFSILGDKPLRQVFETTFGLPASFGAIDVDKQVEILQSRVASTFGESSVSQFADPAKVEDLVRKYLARSDLQALGAASSPAQAALTLLQQASANRRGR
jgi:hypothetical protein